MSEPNYKPNSHKSKEEQRSASEERKIEKVVTGTAKVKKKNELHKLADVFISEDVKNVKSYVLGDVLVPAIKKAIVDIVTDGINMIFYGGTRRGSRSSDGSRVSYRSFYDRRDDDRRPSGRSRFDFDEIIFETRPEAENVLDQMGDVIKQYGFVTVADMYDMADLTQPFTSNKYGWMNVRSAEVVRVRDGYVIKLSKPSPID